jgi:sugar-specific transcriptional regulator TrmB
MEHKNRAELVELGLSPTEAQIYLALLQSAALSASAIATTTGLSRTASIRSFVR